VYGDEFRNVKGGGGNVAQLLKLKDETTDAAGLRAFKNGNRDQVTRARRRTILSTGRRFVIPFPDNGARCFRTVLTGRSWSAGFTMQKLHNRTLHLHVFDYDRFSRDDSIGETYIELNNVSLAAPI